MVVRSYCASDVCFECQEGSRNGGQEGIVLTAQKFKKHVYNTPTEDINTSDFYLCQQWKWTAVKELD